MAGCGIGDGGVGLPAQRAGDTFPGVREEIRGTLEVAANGCFELVVDGSRWYAIWPVGSQRDDLVRLPEGQVVAEGDTVVGIGALTPTGPLVAQGGYWQNALSICAPGADQVLVLDIATVEPAP